MKVDVVLVGFGLAGLAVAEQLRRAGKSFVVIDQPQLGASHCAAGIYNPTILKRYTMAWEAPALLDEALGFYKELEGVLGTSFLYPLPIARVFSSISEQNQWMSASDQHQFKPYLLPKIQTETPTEVNAPLGYGRVVGVGRLAISELLLAYRTQLIPTTHFRKEPFLYDAFKSESKSVVYKDIVANHIIFCQGAALRSNPFFKDLPLRGSHGDMLRIHAPGMDTTHIWKSRLFVVPQGNNEYWVGASFNNQRKDPVPTEKGKKWLMTHLNRLLDIPFTVIAHLGQVRPTVVDRRPLVGTHPNDPKIHLLNGLGSRGVLTAPQMGVHLHRSIFENIPLPDTISITRFAADSC
jgi:glycine/D-amino acid oxidase-like deaminating enzyme